MADLGLDFKPPRSSAVRSWSRIRGMYTVGHVWHTCGCSGPGFIPTNATDYRTYLTQRAELFSARLKTARRRPTLDRAARLAEAHHWAELLERVQSELERQARRSKLSRAGVA